MALDSDVMSFEGSPEVRDTQSPDSLSQWYCYRIPCRRPMIYAAVRECGNRPHCSQVGISHARHETMLRMTSKSLVLIGEVPIFFVFVTFL